MYLLSSYLNIKLLYRNSVAPAYLKVPTTQR